MNTSFRQSEPDPPFPSGAVVRDVRGDGWRVRLDLSPQVLSLDIPETEVDWSIREADLSPACPRTGLVSASMLAVKAKLFDDGLYAAAELAAQPEKTMLLSALEGLSPTVAAAAYLGGITAALPQRAREIAGAHLRNERLSKPVGFYTWREDLRRIFQQDRLLQQELDGGEASTLAGALGADPTLARAYARHLEFVAKLTNPLSDSKPDLRLPGGLWFFPPSRSHEGDLAARLVGMRPVPDGFSLADEMVMALRAGTLDVTPTEASGWYDLQTWALEPLVLLEKMPENARLRTNARYREQLDELVKAVLSLMRETHVKQSMLHVLGAPMAPGVQEPFAWIQPGLTVEPVWSYYRRRAQTYEFVRDVLDRDGRLGGMRRLTQDGPEREPLAEELAGMVALFRGAAAVAGHELGMEAARDEVAAPFRRFAAAPDTGGDIRMMVPAFYDIGRQKLKVWAILGWDMRDLGVGFASEPTARVLEGGVRVRFFPEERQLAYPVFAEAYVSRLLDRDEFRAHCDRHKTAARILQHL